MSFFVINYALSIAFAVWIDRKVNLMNRDLYAKYGPELDAGTYDDNLRLSVYVVTFIGLISFMVLNDIMNMTWTIGTYLIAFACGIGTSAI